MAENIETRGGSDGRWQRSRVLRIDDAEQRLQAADHSIWTPVGRQSPEIFGLHMDSTRWQSPAVTRAVVILFLWRLERTTDCSYI
jgi:hypothetical protein